MGISTLKYFICYGLLVTACHRISAQESFTVTPFWEHMDTAHYRLTLLMSNEDEQSINISTTFKVTYEGEDNGNHIVHFDSDSSHLVYSGIQEGDIRSIMAFWSINLAAEISPNGELVQIFDIDSVMGEIAINSPGNQRRQLQQMLAAKAGDLNTVASLLYKLNYGGVFKHLGERYYISDTISTDTFVAESGTDPAFYSHHTTFVTRQGAFFRLQETIKQNSVEHTIFHDNFQFIFEPAESLVHITTTLDRNGVMQSWKTGPQLRTGGKIKIIAFGKELPSYSTEDQQIPFSTITLERLQ